MTASPPKLSKSVLNKGIYLLNKPIGWSSFDVVNKIRADLEKDFRERFGEKKRIKVGHSGTLDPFAEGLLIIAIGSATKRLSEMNKLDKVYRATLMLGASSSTGDLTGEIAKLEAGKKPTQAAISLAMQKFVGEIQQTPPAFSAKKINGKRAYKLAREGKTVVLEPKAVTIYEFDLLAYDFPKVEFRCRVSSGTYIRTLAEDLAKGLGQNGYLESLTRESIGEFSLDDALPVKGTNFVELVGLI